MHGHNEHTSTNQGQVGIKMSEPESILNKATSFANRDLNMNHFPIRAENLFQRIFSDIRVKATNKNLCSTARQIINTKIKIICFIRK